MTTSFSHFNTGIVLEQSDVCTCYSLNPSEGTGTAEVYSVMSGVELAVLSLQTPRFVPAIHYSGDALEINHCRQGRAEFRMGDGCLQYIGENDLFLSAVHNHSESIDLPLGFYSGIAVMIDLTHALEAERRLHDVGFRLDALLSRFFLNDECFLIVAKEEISRIFSGMYDIPREARGVYYRIKILELLLYLHYFNAAAEPQRTAYAKRQVDIVKQVQKQITEEPQRRYTIETLSSQHLISATALKSGFKAVYGTSIANYMKGYRIRLAAEMLRGSSKSVEEIAAEVGYESPSKFSAAFKAQTGDNPLEYRKKRRNT